MSSNQQRSAGTPSTVPSTNEDDDHHSLEQRNIANPQRHFLPVSIAAEDRMLGQQEQHQQHPQEQQQHQQQQQQQQRLQQQVGAIPEQIGTLSAFSSPRQFSTSSNSNSNGSDNINTQQSSNNPNQPLPPNVALQHTISSVSAGNQSNTTGNNIGSSAHSGAFSAALSGGGGLVHESPLLNGENIVLLSFSNDTTPTGVTSSAGVTPTGLTGVNIHQTNEAMAGAAGAAAGGGGMRRIGSAGALMGMFGGSRHEQFNIEEEEANDMTLSPSSIVNVDMELSEMNNNVELNIEHSHTHSPPPESIHSGQITTLSPPPISLKSSTDRTAHSYAVNTTASGSQSLFSREREGGGSIVGSIGRGPIGQQQQQQYHSQNNQPPPTVASAGATPSKKRPPLPPRWAIGAAPPPASHHAGMVAPIPQQPGITGITSGTGMGAGGMMGGGDMVDVVPNHLPPPKQIGPLSHRRVMSTGDASFLSVLTDPDSIPDGGMGEDNSPPTAVGGGGVGPTGPTAGVAGTRVSVPGPSVIHQPLPMNPARKRGVSWDFGATGGGMGVVGASHSESDGSLNKYKNEEEAAFDTLGILQPILQDHHDGMNNVLTGGGDDVTEDLMQPILLDDDEDGERGETEEDMAEPVLGGTSSAFTSSFTSVGEAPDVTTPPTNAASSSIPPPPTIAQLPPRSPPPPPPEKVVKKQSASPGGRPKLEHTRAKSSMSMKNLLLTRKKSEGKKDLTQFEDEAELAIMEALNAYGMQESFRSRSSDEKSTRRISEEDNDEESSDDDDDEVVQPGGEDQYLIPELNAPSSDSTDGPLVPSQVVHPEQPGHTKDVSALTTYDLEMSPYSTAFSPKRPGLAERAFTTGSPQGRVLSPTKPGMAGRASSTSIMGGAAAMGIRTRGESIFEDSAWTEGYDEAGRIDGTLPEEQDSKLAALEIEKPVAGVDLNPRVAVAAAPKATRPPLHPLPSKKEGDSASQHTNISKKAVAASAAKDVDSSDTSRHSKMSKAKGDNFTSKKKFDLPKLEDPTAQTGLRHRRANTIAAKNMADELAQMAALHGGGEGSNRGLQHQRNKTNVTLNATKGIDNLVAGLDILDQREQRKLDEEHDREERVGPLAAAAAAVADAVSGGGGAPGDDGGEDDGPHDEETGEANNNGDSSNKPSYHKGGHRHRIIPMGQRSETLYHLRIWYNDLIRPKLPAFMKGAAHMVCFIIVPLLSVAFILYYGVGNPMTGGLGAGEEVNEAEEEMGEQVWVVDGEHGSWSWWVLFVARQAFLLSWVKAGEVISIDIFALRTPLFMKTVGSFATLMIVQARGWPYVLSFWSLMDFCFLFGSHKFARHWLFWQDWIGLFNESNPAGSFLHSELYMRILVAALFVGVITSLKRLWLATYLGKRSYAHYGPELEILLAKMLLVSQVSHLARQIESHVVTSRVSDGYAFMMTSKTVALPGLTTDSEDDSPTLASKRSLDGPNKTDKNYNSSGESPKDGFGQSLLEAGIGGKLVSSLSKPRLKKTETTKNLYESKSSSRLEIMALLEEWEEPDIKTNSVSKASIKDILQFRQAVALMDDTYPFTPAFGPGKTRAMCVQSSEALFERLQQKTPDTGLLLPFETLSEIAYDTNGQLVRDKVKALIKLFRPDRKGFLTRLDFVSSIDDVYKDLRLFRASLANSTSIDDSFESIINSVFFVIVVILVLIIVGFQLWEPILSFSAFFFSFSFMFGPASSKYFEGILLIFVRRPYDIGDKIALSDPEQDTSAGGSSTWFVEKVSLFTTTVRFATTNEVATYSNGSLARLRIINAKRSPKAIIYVYMKFGSDVPYQMIKVYQAAIENFVKSRPREWSQLNGFRATRVEMELNYIEYVIVATHREMWQNVGPILQSQADLASFSLEVSKKLNLRYHNPPKPIHLSMKNKRRKDDDREDESYGSSEIQQVTKMFNSGTADLGEAD